MLEKYFSNQQLRDVVLDLCGGRLLHYDYQSETEKSEKNITYAYHTFVYENGYRVNVRYSDEGTIDLFASTQRYKKLLHLGLFKQKNLWKFFQIINEISLLSTPRNEDELLEIGYREHQTIRDYVAKIYDYNYKEIK